ncbi:hypothetical protein A2926_03775 [Candidatus Giovannonibacteria bacterium RIFCSPLOWO2_01_FULL_44_40]|uniref:HicB-like antitoxin of toxin-antitoxin system domain-containing protein n=1 Tax=Candidatus Giovannonibacteria bacterium RIFCSPHIGHO2_01_FULL_45_23 TaxID=1798325 RepID=A0A1F5VII1_9BACT|nr:MAG: hypothetical protein A2834_03770 [Candidatus Giovannonibacteria bacterium RIFCSPHIGHO2_01_FULL_45_23]OGF75833.1 MAG: hypothetical protein A3C77_04600 [Candidatus Giovannonibacteria bacterium RIFCSPHIGHO2_02_FULL_45_13]OGF80254.1 MAG: hypothetical protein A2926_03775 [Candidatus Giovannonibacteria bacterium RIFCSPLOWO2_01_FULL_44_40]
MKSNNYTFRVIIEPSEDGGYHGFVPLLKGLHTQGDDIEKVRQNLKEATICHLRGLLKDSEPVPQEENALEMVQSISFQELALT